MTSDKSIDRVLHDLQERARELNCLYQADELLDREAAPLDDVLADLLRALPTGFQYPGVCVARVVLGGRVFEPGGFEPSPRRLAAPILVRGERAGEIEVYYTEPVPAADGGPFLPEERKLLEVIAERIGRFVARIQHRRTLLKDGPGSSPQPEWAIVLEFLRQTDRTLLARLGRKMVNYLCWNGIEEAERLLRDAVPACATPPWHNGENNTPRPRTKPEADAGLTEAAFRLADQHLPADEILDCIHNWIREAKTTFLKTAVERLDTPLAELADALQRFAQGGIQEKDLSTATRTELRASLVRRFLTDQLEFVEIAKQYVSVADFHELCQRVVFPARSHGRVGGKTAGVFLASRVVARSPEYKELIGDLRVPRSWHIPSDGILDFVHHNDIDDVYNRKYEDPERVRLEYPYIVQLFKRSCFSSDVLHGFSDVLDDLEGRPIVVRSSSLLEDRFGSAFSGKYKSLFLSNTGTKRERLAALTDAVAEVYASVFSPDPIEYRLRRGLLDLHEEMGILIQEVVGTRVGPYWMPAFAGVGFSSNEFRWSPRIRREDGLLRMVPGLGTRAVDRLVDEYPVLIAPGQPGLRVNQGAENVTRYSPRRADVINLETGQFETVDLKALFAQHGAEMPFLRQMVSIVDQDHVRRPIGLFEPEADDLVVTFEGLFTDTPFVAQMRALLQVLREKLKTPVDIEFASDGQHVYLLQCRPQFATEDASPSSIPRDVPEDRVIFSARRYVSSGSVGDITHVVYVDPDAYGRAALSRLPEIGRAVGRLNRVLPKRQFILMGPGRWGSRGDVRLGVPVTYTDISNTAMLIEIARKKGAYLPDVSFGTHFFQDLVESSIRYLPLYPDDPGVAFKEDFFLASPNSLGELVPELEELSDVVHVIDVPRVTGGRVLRVLMNGDLDEAVGLLASTGLADAPRVEPQTEAAPRTDEHWRWRVSMAQRLAAALEPARFGVKAAYLFGSTANGSAGPASDIDLLLHVEDDARWHDLAAWLEGWSLALAGANYLRTGHRAEALLDVHYATDADIAAGAGVAAKIGTEAVRPLPMGRAATLDDSLGDPSRHSPTPSRPPPQEPTR